MLTSNFSMIPVSRLVPILLGELEPASRCELPLPTWADAGLLTDSSLKAELALKVPIGKWAIEFDPSGGEIEAP